MKGEDLRKAWSALQSKREKVKFLFKNVLRLEDIPKDILDEIMADVDLRLALLDGYPFKDSDVDILREYIVKGQVGNFLAHQILERLSDNKKVEFQVLWLLRDESKG